MTSRKRRIRRSVQLLLILPVSVLAFNLPQTHQPFHARAILQSRRRSIKPLYESRQEGEPNSTNQERTSGLLIHTKTLGKEADKALREKEDSDDYDDDVDIEEEAMNRRLFMGATLVGVCATLAGGPESFRVAAAAATNANVKNSFGKLEWESTPVNKRTGVTVFDAEKSGFNVRFVTYLARFLLVFDNDCQKWWYSRAADIPRRASAEEVEEIRLKQFGAFSASVEVGLQEYRGKDGPKKLMEALLYRYCPDIETVRRKRRNRGLPILTEEQGASVNYL